jgi:hypothetical protein
MVQKIYCGECLLRPKSGDDGPQFGDDGPQFSDGGPNIGEDTLETALHGPKFGADGHMNWAISHAGI